MAKNKSKTEQTIPEKKLNRLLVEDKLEAALSELKSVVSKKKFDRSIKKAAKLINKDFSKKTLDNFRKQQASDNAHPDASMPETEIKDTTSLLIEELP